MQVVLKLAVIIGELVELLLFLAYRFEGLRLFHLTDIGLRAVELRIGPI